MSKTILRANHPAPITGDLTPTYVEYIIDISKTTAAPIAFAAFGGSTPVGVSIVDQRLIEGKNGVANCAVAFGLSVGSSAEEGDEYRAQFQIATLSLTEPNVTIDRDFVLTVKTRVIRGVIRSGAILPFFVNWADAAPEAATALNGHEAFGAVTASGLDGWTSRVTLTGTAVGDVLEAWSKVGFTVPGAVQGIQGVVKYEIEVIADHDDY